MQQNTTSVAECLRKLCSRLSNDEENAYRLMISYMSPHDTPLSSISHSETLVCQRIRNKLLTISSSRDADKFVEYYQKLKSTSVMKNKLSMLVFLYSLAPSHSDIELSNSVNSMHFNTPLRTSSNRPSTLYPPKFNLCGEASPANSKSTVELYRSFRENRNINDIGKESETSLVAAALLSAQGIRSEKIMARGGKGVLMDRLAELGFLHDRIKESIDPNSGVMPQGLMAEGFVSALRDELTEYYKDIAILQSQLQNNECTLRRMCVWSLEPLHRLKWLATIAHVAQHTKGGALATCVHRFLSHGDVRVQQIAKRLLLSLSRPLLLMLSRWLLHGEIEDPFNEFFIEIRNGIPLDRMWHDKYRVREWMVPSFINHEQAEQILATGKSVVFLREACSDHDIDHADHALPLKKLLDPSEGMELWWSSDRSAALQLAAAHEVVSGRLVRALVANHHLLDHLYAHRRYLLLAQGDFVHHLMRLLQKELNKSASSLYVHNLTCTLEAAVRATNAQFEATHVLSRLHVNLFPSQPSDCGWDVFALQYRLEGPLGTLFPASIEVTYRALFSHLWRIKRIEYGLHAAWREHAVRNKEFQKVPEAREVLRRAGCVRAEALRLCEVVQEAAGCVGAAEAAWRELFDAVQRNAALDTLLRLHRAFIKRAAIDALIHHSTKELKSYLGNVLDEILTLKTFEENLHKNIAEELQRRDQYEQLKAERNNKGEWSSRTTEELADKESRKQFQQYLANRKADLNVITRSYREHVKALILKLALHEEVSLQTLAFRLDYNDFYKRGDSKLHEPLTYQHRRLSEITFTREKSTEKMRKK